MLYYYGYRYYSTELGRWITRDPIGERNGYNFYAFAQNNSINMYDLFGLWVHPNGIISPENVVIMIGNVEREALSYYRWHLSLHENDEQELKDRIWRIHTLGLLKKLSRETFSTDYIKGEANKWIFTCKYGWIDIGHFFTNAYFSSLLKNPLLVYDLSITQVESWQSVALKILENPLLNKVLWFVKDETGQSAFTAEDLNSNFQGAYFQHGGIGDIAPSFSRLLKDAGAVKHVEANGVNALKVLKEDAASLLAGPEQTTYIGERLKTKEAQLSYQKSSFKAFCLLCDGDSAKPDFQY
jgi:hypothetical protein